MWRYRLRIRCPLSCALRQLAPIQRGAQIPALRRRCFQANCFSTVRAHIVHFLKEKPGTSLCCPGAAAQTAQERPGPWTIVTVKHGRSSASLAASPLSPDNGVREYSSGVGQSAAGQRNVKVGREPWYACARSAGDCFIRCRSRASMRMAGLWLYKSSPVLYAQSMKRCGPVLRVYIFCFVGFYAYHPK